MPDWDEDYNGIAALGRCGWVHARRHVDVEAGLVGYQMLLEDAVKTVLVVLREEDVVGAEFRELAVQCPVEGDT